MHKEHTSTLINRIAVSAFFFLSGLSTTSWFTRFPEIFERLQLSVGRLGSIIMLPAVCFILFLPVAGLLVSAHGSRKPLLIATLLHVAILPFFGLVTASWQLSLCMLLFGFCGSIICIAMNTQAVILEAMYGKTIMASLCGFEAVAALSGALISGWMSTKGIPMYLHFSLITLISFIVAGVAFLYTVTDNETGRAERAIFMWPDKFLLILGVIAFCTMMGEASLLSWTFVYLRNVVHVDLKIAGYGTIIFTGAMAIFYFISDYLINRFGAKRVLQFSGGLIALGAITAIVLPYLPTVIAGFLLIGAGISSVLPVLNSTAGKSRVMFPEMALALVATIGNIGFTAGPRIFEFAEHFTSVRTTFSIIVFLGICITLMSMQFKKEKWL